MKYQSCCFSSHFGFPVFVVFLFVLRFLQLWLAVVNSLTLLILMYFSTPCIDGSMQSSMLASPLPPFLVTYNVRHFLALWSIYLSSSLVHFKNGSDFLTKSSDQVFSPLMRFLFQSLVSRSFLFLLKYTFLIFFFHLCLFDGIYF